VINWHESECLQQPVRMPVYVGAVEIAPDLRVEVTRWPNLLHRTITRLLLGWRWTLY
jgi:hypothetical protein